MQPQLQQQQQMQPQLQQQQQMQFQLQIINKQINNYNNFNNTDATKLNTDLINNFLKQMQAKTNTNEPNDYQLSIELKIIVVAVKLMQC